MLLSINTVQNEEVGTDNLVASKGQALPQEASFSDLFASMRVMTDGESAKSINGLESPITIDLASDVNSGLVGRDVAAVNSELFASDTSSNVFNSINVQQGVDVTSGIVSQVDSALRHVNDSPLLSAEQLTRQDSLPVDLNLQNSVSVDAVDVSKITDFVQGNTLARPLNVADSDVVMEAPVQGLLTSNEVVATLGQDINIEDKSSLTTLSESEQVDVSWSEPPVITNENTLPLKPESLGQNIVQSIQQGAVLPNQTMQNMQAASQQSHVTQWGNAAVSGDTNQVTASLNQGGQQFSNGSQGQQSFLPQQQLQQFQEQRSKALEQQLAVKAGDELLLKADAKDHVTHTDLSVSDRRHNLPLGMQSISVPVKSPEWGKALGQRMVFMANNKLQQAQITLNPEKLGPVQIKIHMDKDQQVHVSMNAHHSLTREAMESALPRLREMFEQAGIDLGSVNVGDDKPFSDKNNDSKESHEQSEDNLQDVQSNVEPMLKHTTSLDNLIDFYA